MGKHGMNRRRVLCGGAGLLGGVTATGMLGGGVWAASGKGEGDQWSLASQEVVDEGLVAQQREAAREKIAGDRAAGLAVLKPRKKDLAHGLELHRESLVFDTYGFSPRSAFDGTVMRAAVESGASPLELEDLREDMNKTRCVTHAGERAEFVEAWKASGVTCILQNAGQEGQAPMRLLKRLAYFTYLTDMMPGFIRKAATPGQIVEAKEAGRRCLYFSGNGVPLTQQWESVEDELRYVRVYYELGIRMMHLTYNRRNMIGDGCAEVANGGLSDFGRAAVKEMNRVGVMVDVAHSGYQTSLEGALQSEKPMVASHTVADGLNHHIRAKPDGVIRAIADTGGMVGICGIPAFVGGQGDLNAMLDHVDYVAKKFGSEHVGIGTDVAYSSTRDSAERKLAGSMPKRRQPFRALWPADAFTGYPSRHASMAWTNWPLFTVGLVQRGYTDDQIRGILGGNMMRVARGAGV